GFANLRANERGATSRVHNERLLAVPMACVGRRSGAEQRDSGVARVRTRVCACNESTTHVDSLCTQLKRRRSGKMQAAVDGELVDFWRRHIEYDRECVAGAANGD